MTSESTNPEAQAAPSEPTQEQGHDQAALPDQAVPVMPVVHTPGPVAVPEPSLPAVFAPAGDAHEEMSFAEMLAEHEKEEPKSRLTPGQRVTVRVVAVTSDTVFVSTGSKVDGIVDREELEVNGELPYAVGDSLDLYVVTVSPQEVKLSKIIRGAGNLSALEEAKDAGLPVEGKVTGQIKGGYAVDIMKRRAFCPTSQIALRPLDNPEEPVGKTYPFLITRLEKGGRNIVVSRRSLLEREQAESRDALLAAVHEGDTTEAVITRLTPFVAFAELAEGVEGLIHVSELSWSRITQPDEAVGPGDRVRVKILSINKNDKGTRISLSVKQVTDNPWKDVDTRLTPGDVVTGKVVRTTPFGAFVEVLPGIEGLVHISELSYERRVNKAEDVVVVGDVISVKIKEIDLAKKRVSLSLRDVSGDPWSTVGDTFALDADVTGTVEKRAPFGLFVALAPGITGLLPNSVLQNSPARKDIERLNAGDAVSVRIKEIDNKNRRISLAPAGDENDTQAVEKDWKKHAAPAAPKTPSIGALGMALQSALQNKKK